MATNPTRKRGANKPNKPYPDFPLFPHASGRWAKKIRGKLHYFGPWSDPYGALEKYQQQRDDLHAGRTPRQRGDEPEVRDVVNAFLTAKQRKVEAGELKPGTFSEYHAAAARLVDAFGATRVVSDLSPDDFGQFRSGLAKRYGPSELGKQVQMVRSIFKYAYEAGLIDKPMRFGPEFTRPSRKAQREVRRNQPARMFSDEQVRTLIDHADTTLRAMILLGINAGWGQTDVAELPRSALDLDAAVADHPRPKTGIDRRVTLWPETVSAIREALTSRPKARSKADEQLVFLTTHGRRWVRYRPNGNGGGASIDAVALQFRKLLEKFGYQRRGLNFYALRHTFRTVADEAGDQPAIDRIMGHDAADMPSRYRQRISDDRLRAVTDHVRRWLWPPNGKKKQSGKKAKAEGRSYF